VYRRKKILGEKYENKDRNRYRTGTRFRNSKRTSRNTKRDNEMIKKLWRLWAKSLGEKVGHDREADNVAIFRSCIVLFNVITCCFIIANTIRHW